MCRYCGARRSSASACADGRVRIRCSCGGQHGDGQKRMHAYWERVSGEGTSEGESDQAGKDVQKDEKVEKDQTQTQELCGFQKVVRQEPKIEASQAPPVQSVTKPIWN